MEESKGAYLPGGLPDADPIIAMWRAMFDALRAHTGIHKTADTRTGQLAIATSILLAPAFGEVAQAAIAIAKEEANGEQ